MPQRGDAASIEFLDGRNDGVGAQGTHQQAPGKGLLDSLDRGVSLETVPVRVLVEEEAATIHFPRPGHAVDVSVPVYGPHRIIAAAQKQQAARPQRVYEMPDLAGVEWASTGLVIRVHSPVHFDSLSLGHAGDVGQLSPA